jgi:SAM-dependent methyltransferase
MRQRLSTTLSQMTKKYYLGFNLLRSIAGLFLMFVALHYLWCSFHSESTRSPLSVEEWKLGFAAERGFWGKWMSTAGGIFALDFARRFNETSVTDPWIIDNLRSCVNMNVHMDKKKVYVLDVGSGPATTIGRRNQYFNIEVFATDPLAPVYDQLLKEHDLSPPIRTQYAMVENLSSAFSPNFFDLVHMKNALDHCQDPLKGIQQMLSVVRTSCAVFLTHSRNEAEKEKYVGFHQWNFDMEEGSFIIWRKAVRHNVTNMFLTEASITPMLAGDSHDHLNVVLRKLK